MMIALQIVASWALLGQTHQSTDQATQYALGAYSQAINGKVTPAVESVKLFRENIRAPFFSAANQNHPTQNDLRAAYAKAGSQTKESAAIAFTLASQYKDSVGLNAKRIVKVIANPPEASGAPKALAQLYRTTQDSRVLSQLMSARGDGELAEEIGIQTTGLFSSDPGPMLAAAKTKAQRENLLGILSYETGASGTDRAGIITALQTVAQNPSNSTQARALAKSFLANSLLSARVASGLAPFSASAVETKNYHDLIVYGKRFRPHTKYWIVVQIQLNDTGRGQLIAASDANPAGLQMLTKDESGNPVVGQTPDGKVLAYFACNNHSKDISYDDELKVGDYGPFPSGYSTGYIGVWPIQEYTTTTSDKVAAMGPHRIIIGGKPGPGQRVTRIHGGRGRWNYMTDGCIRVNDTWTNDPVIETLGKVIAANPGSGDGTLVVYQAYKNNVKVSPKY